TEYPCRPVWPNTRAFSGVLCCGFIGGWGKPPISRRKPSRLLSCQLRNSSSVLIALSRATRVPVRLRASCLRKFSNISWCCASIAPCMTRRCSGRSEICAEVGRGRPEMRTRTVDMRQARMERRSVVCIRGERTLLPEEVRQELLSRRCEHGLRMELDAFHSHLLVAQPHDQSARCGGDFETGRQAGTLDNQRM